MRAVIYRVRIVVRRGWLGMTMLTLIVALGSAVVMTIAQGAHRTATAPDRFTARSPIAFDAQITQEDAGRPRSDEIRSLAGVASVDAMTFVFGGILDDSEDGVSDALVFSGHHRPAGMDIVSGRATDPANPAEIVGSRDFVEQSDAAIGDTFDLITFTQDQANNDGFAASDPQGPSLRVELVGIIDGPGDDLDDPTPVTIVSKALLNEPGLGVALTVMAVDLRPGVTLEVFRDQIDELPESDGLTLERGHVISDSVRRAVRTQVSGLWLLAAIAGLAALAVLGQLIARQVRPTRTERRRFAALGFTNAQIVTVAVASSLIPIVAGSVLGLGLSIGASGVFPTGFVRVIEPDPGLQVAWHVAVASLALCIVALAAWTVTSLLLTDSRARSPLPSPLVDAIATRTTNPAAATGVRFAFGPATAGRRSTLVSIAGVAMIVAVLVGAMTFGASLNRLLDEPFRYGSYYDIAIGDNGAFGIPDGIVDLLDENPDITSLALFAGSRARVGDTHVPIVGMTLIRGDASPAILAGELPTGDDQIALGRVTADDIGAAIGDAVTLIGPTQTRSFTVAGLAVIPGFGANDGMGEGGIVTMGGLAGLDDDTQPTTAAVRLRIDTAAFLAAQTDVVAAQSADIASAGPFTPAEIVDIARVRSIPFVLAIVLATLTLLTVGHVVSTSIHSRGRDVAILRALGAGRSWVSRAVHWQATLFTACAVAIGIPVGIVTGRLVFVAFANDMGAVSGATFPLATIAGGFVAILALANSVAAWSARRARGAEAAQLLRTE